MMFLDTGCVSDGCRPGLRRPAVRGGLDVAHASGSGCVPGVGCPASARGRCPGEPSRLPGCRCRERVDGLGRPARGWRIMRRIGQGLQGELRPMLGLAGPVVLAELGWMAMGIVDTIFVGRLGAEAIGAVSLGSASTSRWRSSAWGCSWGSTPWCRRPSAPAGAEECHRWLVQGLYLCLVLSPLVMVAPARRASPGWDGSASIPAVLAQALPFLRAMTWGTLPLFLYAAFRRYLQGMGMVKPVMFALISANVDQRRRRLDPHLRPPRAPRPWGWPARAGRPRSRGRTWPPC